MKTVTKYAVLTVLGVVFFKIASAWALAERGYAALGGEGFFLLLPVVWWILSTTIRDFTEDEK